MHFSNSFSRFAATALLSTTSLLAQCGFDWQPGPAAPGPIGTVHAIAPLANGGLVACGRFLTADSSSARNIATWNGTEWLPLGTGLEGVFAISEQANAVVVLANGDIVAAGRFATAGGQPADNIARWNGTSWSALGGGLAAEVEALDILANGDLMARIGSSSLHRWDGVSWTQFGATLPGTLTDIEETANGDILASGSFSFLGPLLRWDGSAWVTAPTSALFGSYIADMVTLPSGSILCAGYLNLPAGIAQVALFDGSNFVPLNPPVQQISTLALRANGSVAALTRLVSGSPQDVAIWDGSTWTALGVAPPNSTDLQEDASGSLVIGSAGGRTVHRFDGTAWQPLGSPAPPRVKVVATGHDGSVFVGGTFQSFEGLSASNIVRWDGDSYGALGLGVDGEVKDIAIDDDGSIVVSGSFHTAGGSPATGIARWDGQNWSTLGSPPAAFAPSSIAIAPNGDVYARASGVWRFDGGSWAQVNLSLTTAFIEDLTVLPTGELVLAGLFFGGPGSFGLALVDNGIMTPFPGSLTAGILQGRQILIADNGDLIVGATNSSHRWNGSTWTTFAPLVHMFELPNGDFIGASTGSPDPIARVSGTTVAPLAAVQGFMITCAVAGDGDLLVGGPIQTINGQVSFGFARAEAQCPASVDSFGAGCLGSAGPVTLTSATRPWIGADYRATAIGMPPQSLAVQALGTATPAVPLPLGAPGCVLMVAPFLTTLAATAQGQLELTLALPNDAALVGRTLRQQVVGVELDPTGITQLTSSNALDLTIGTL